MMEIRMPAYQVLLVSKYQYNTVQHEWILDDSLKETIYQNFKKGEKEEEEEAKS